MGKKTLPPEVRDYFVKMGREGGKLGGPKRAAKLTAEQRRASALKAIKARWAKAKRDSTDV